MAEQGQAEQTVNNEAGEGSNVRDALRRRLSGINDRARELERKVYKFPSELAPSDDFAHHVEAFEREFHSLQKDLYSFELQVDNCICENPTECRAHLCPPLDEIDNILIDVKTLIDVQRLDAIGDRQPMLRDVIQVVEGLPDQKNTENHQNENIQCKICGAKCSEGVSCHLPCNEGVLFHRNCIGRQFELIASIICQGYELKSEIDRQKTAYEADRDNQADNYAIELYMFVRVLESLGQAYYWYRSEIDKCKCVNRSHECGRYMDLLERFNNDSREIINLIRECWSDDLKERVERQLEIKTMQVVEGLPAINISENHINENVVCAICLTKFK